MFSSSPCSNFLTTHAMSPSLLPELVYVVVRNFEAQYHDERETLVNCSRVSRSWRRPCMERLFADMVIQQSEAKDEVSQFNAFLSHPDHAFIAPYIKTLAIKQRRCYPQSRAAVCFDVILAMVDKLPQLSMLKINGYRSSGRLHIAIGSLSATRTPIGVPQLFLDIETIDHGYDGLLVVLKALSPIRSLTIATGSPALLSPSLNAPPPAPPAEPFLHLEYLGLISPVGPLFRFLEQSIHSCRRVRMNRPEDEFFPAQLVGALIKKISHSLEYLCIQGDFTYRG